MLSGHLHMEHHGVLVGVDLDAGQLGAVLVDVLLEVVAPIVAKGARKSLLPRISLLRGWVN
jgi:hypothetical protein